MTPGTRAHFNDTTKEETSMKTKMSILVAALLAGLATAFAVVDTASAYTPDQLPNMGYRVIESNLGNNCHGWQVSGYGASTDLGSDCEPGFQAALDEFVERTYPKPPTTAPAPTTTDTATAPAPPTTETTAPVTATETNPAATAPAPTTTDSTTPAPAPAPVTTAPTAADTTAAAITDLQAQVAALQAAVAQISGELTRLVQILEQWPGIDPGILAQLMAVQQ